MLKAEILLETLWDEQRVSENSGSLPLYLLHELPAAHTGLDQSVPGVSEVWARGGMGEPCTTDLATGIAWETATEYSFGWFFPLLK